jgi:hypothetical protein
LFLWLVLWLARGGIIVLRRRYFGPFVLTIVVVVSLFLVAFNNSTLSGFFLLDTDFSFNGSGNVDASETASDSPEFPPTTSLGDDSTIRPRENVVSSEFFGRFGGRGSSSGGGGGSGGFGGGPPSFLGWRFLHLHPSFVFWSNGEFLQDVGNRHFQGSHRFTLYKGADLFTAFNITFQQDVDFNSLFLDIDVLNGKSLVYDPTDVLSDTTLYVPRFFGHTQIRICPNVTSLSAVSAGCSGEAVVSLLDSALSTTNAGDYFVFSGKGFGAVSELDTLPPRADLISPNSSAAFIRRNVTVSFSSADASVVDHCAIRLDGSTVATAFNVTNWQANVLDLTQLSAGVHSWRVACFDLYGHQNVSIPRDFVVIPTINFSGASTDLTAVSNLSSVSNFTLEIPTTGRISFMQPVDLSMGPDLDNFVQIGSDFVEINSQQIPSLNVPAVLSIYNTTFQHPVILRDGVYCDDCTVLDTNGLVSFLVPHFTRYVVSENARLHMYDTTDFQARQAGQSVTIYANYTNVTNNGAITGATCTATFSDTGSQTMVYNGGSLQYEYARSFSTVGVHSAFVNCVASGFTTLNGTEYVSITNPSARQPNGATVVSGAPSRATPDTAGNTTAYAGNTTEITISGFTNTQHWQGFYGNVSGTLELANGAGNILYNWSNLDPQGEVYATSAFGVNFPTIMCANATHMSEEQTLIGGNATDVDSVNNTFNSQNHPLFYVGSTQFNANACSSIRLFRANGAVTNNFYEVLLGDGALNVIYTAILEQSTTGFDSNPHDFEMIVGENGYGTDTAATTYYFYLEIE